MVRVLPDRQATAVHFRSSVVVTQHGNSIMASNDDSPSTDAVDEAPAKEKLNLDVKIERKSACERHITVTVPRDDVDRYFSEAFDDLMPKAAVPGFRAGRAPRKLVESRFQKDVAEQVKGSLLMDSLEQISADHELSPISEPDFDPLAVELPEQGPLTFEFNIEVRPEFELPQWKGLKLERPTRQFSDADVQEQLQRLLSRHGQLVPQEGGAAAGDFVVLSARFEHQGQRLSVLQEQTLRVAPTLSFRDGNLEGFDKLIEGAKAGDKRQGQLQLSDDAPNENLRGQQIEVEIDVLEVKKLELPELTPEFLEQIGSFTSEDDLRGAVRKSLERRLEYHQQQRAREQISALLTEAADWDLPPEMLKRQARREFERAVLELRRSGFGESEIRAHANELMQNSREATARALKQHFILERIAESEDIDASPDDFDDEIELIAEQSGESARRVRASLEKRDLIDTLRNQIVERKVMELIQQEAKFQDTQFQPQRDDTEAVDHAAGGSDLGDIPEAKYGNEAEGLREPVERD